MCSNELPIPNDNDYVGLHKQLICEIQAYNDEYLKIQNDNTVTTANLVVIEGRLRNAISKLQTFASNPDNNSGEYIDPQEHYSQILSIRQLLNNQVQILKSMNGAPKKYNQHNNIYDDYRDNYNNTVIVSLFVTMCGVGLLYFYYSNI